MSFCHCLIWPGLLLLEFGDPALDLLLLALQALQFAGEVVAGLGAFEDLDRLRVRQPVERRLDPLQGRDVRPERLQFLAVVRQDAGGNAGDEPLGQFQQAVEIDERDLRLDHPELGQVPAGLALLGPEGRPEAVDPAVSHRGRFEVKLARLRQVQQPAEVVHLEQRRLVLAHDGREDRRVDQGELVVVEVPPDRVDHRMADLADAPLLLRTEVQVAVPHQELDAVRLGRDRVAFGRTDHLGARDGHLVAADAALFGPDGSGHSQRGLLAQPFELARRPHRGTLPFSTMHWHRPVPSRMIRN